MMLEAGQTIGKKACGCCGLDVDLKLNKNGNCYYYCNPCSHHQRWGKDASHKMKSEYLAKRAKQNAKGQTNGGEKTGDGTDTGGKGFLYGG